LAEDRHSWDSVIRDLSKGHRCYAVDLRGHGETTLGQPEGSAEQLAGDLTAFLEKVSGPAFCVGFSLGGVIVLEAALSRPDLVRKAVVVGTSSKVGRAAAAFFQERIGQLHTNIGDFREALAADTDAQVVRNRDLLAQVAAQRVTAVGDGAGYENAARAMIAMAGEPLTERLKEIQVPVHIVQGTNDVFCPPKAADILREAMPSAIYAEIADAGHLIAVDQPKLLASEISRALETQLPETQK